MNNLLTSSEKRRLKVVDYLEKKRDWVNLEELASASDCSSKTLLSDFKFFEENWSDYLKLDFSKYRGARVSFNHLHNMHSLHKEVLQKSGVMRFLKEVFLEPNYSINEWGKKLFLSESSLYRMVRAIDKEFSPLGITFHTQPCSIIGDKERHIRLLFSNFFEQVYEIYYWPFADINRERLVKMVQRIGQKLGRKMDDRLLNQVAIAVAVTLIRMKQGFLLKSIRANSKSDQLVYNTMLDEKEYLAAALDFELAQGWELEIAQTVMHFLYAWDNEGEKVRISEFVSSFIHNLSTELNVEILPDNKQQVIDRLISIYTSYKSFPHQYCFIPNYFSSRPSRITDDYQEFCVKVQEELQLLERKMLFPWYSEMFYAVLEALFSEWRDLPIRLEEEKKKINILIVSTFGTNHAYTLKSRMNIHFSHEMQAQVYEGKIFDLLLATSGLDEYDIILSNSYMSELPKDKLFLVDTIISTKQLADLAVRIHHLQLKKKLT